jgi:hypothetical protein
MIKCVFAPGCGKNNASENKSRYFNFRSSFRMIVRYSVPSTMKSVNYALVALQTVILPMFRVLS